MIYVLIMVTGLSAGDPVQTQEFATQAACEDAAKWLTAELPRNLLAKCFPLSVGEIKP
jgi:hypothetical protein